MTQTSASEAWPQGRPLVRTPDPVNVPGARFDQARVDRVVRVLRRFRHTKGRWAGVALEPDLWQVEHIIAPIFGWVRPDDEVGGEVRVVREAWIEVPRKAGKTTIASGLANVLLIADDEPGAEVYAAATGLTQASRITDDAKRMLRTAGPDVLSRVRLLADVITVPGTGSVFRALSRAADIAHGLNVHGGVVDEVHMHKSRHLIDAIATGTGARSQPLVIYITTADEGEEGTIYAEKHDYVLKLASGIVDDPTTYGVIFAADPDDDPFAEATLRKANPGAGVSPTMSYLLKEAEKARVEPSYFPTYCRLHLNVRQRPLAKWLSLTGWDAEPGIVDDEKLKGRPCWGGLDLSAVSDLTAWLLVFEGDAPDEVILRSRFWLPEERIEALERQLQVPLTEWVKQRWLNVTEGAVIDYQVVEDQAVADGKTFDLQRVSYDRMFAGQLSQNLAARLKGVDLAPVSQTYLGLSPASKELERLVLAHKVRHGGHPVLRWHADDVEVIRDQQDNLKPVKPDRAKSTKRIDGIAAAVIALDGYIRRPKRRSRQVVGL